MAWVAPAIQGGASLLGGLFGSNAADDARRAQQQGSQQSLNLQRQMYLASLGLQEPWRMAGQGALTQLSQLFGLPYAPYQPASQVAGGIANAGGGALLSAKAIAAQLRSGKSVDDIIKMGFLGGNIGQKQLRRLSQAGASAEDIQRLQTQLPSQSAQAAGAPQMITPAGPDMSVFQTSPDYLFRKEQGMQGIERSAAAKGGAFSGNALKELNNFNSKLASGEFNNFVNNRFRLAGFGSDAAGSQQNAGQYFGAQGGQAMQNMGNARASGIMDRTNYMLSGLGGAGQAFGNWWDQRDPNQSPWWRTPPTFPTYGRGA